MKPIFYRLILAFGLGSAALSAQAGYICKVDGNAVFTEKKIGNDCTESHTDGTANVSPEEAGRAVPERVDLKEALGEAAPEPGDIKVLPRTTGGSVTNTAEAANPRLDIKLRNGKLGEATSGVDTENEDEIKHSLSILLRGRTSITIAHRLNTIEDCDRILVLRRGKIVESGTHRDLLEKNGYYKKLVQTQQKSL